MKRFVTLLYVLLLLPVLLSGCGGGSSSSGSGNGRTGSASFKVDWPTPTRLIPAATASIKVDIVDAGNHVLDSKLLVRPSGALQVTATFTNLVPGNHTARATAFPNADGTGTALATATTPLVITAGHTTNFTITMGSTITQIDVTPATYRINQGETLPLTATARDANGNVVMVAPSQLSWISSAPSIASVTATGATVTVTGVGIGTAQITVTDNESQKFNQFPVIVLQAGANLYTISELPIPVGNQVNVRDMNENGDVLGNTFTGTNGNIRNAIVWKADGTQLNLPGFDGNGINDAGVVVGRGGVFDPAVGTVQTLPGLFPWYFTYGEGINNSGQIVGESTTIGFNHDPVIVQNGVTSRIPGLPGDLTGDFAYRINNVGQVVGFQYVSPGYHAAFLWDSRTNVLTGLGTLGGAESTANDINNLGMIVGDAKPIPNNSHHAFLWQNGTMTDLGTLPGHSNTAAMAINDNGEIVGTDYGTFSPTIAWYWKNGTMIDLTTRVVNGTGWTLLSADTINNQGKIAGTGLHNGQPAAFLLTPTTP